MRVTVRLGEPFWRAVGQRETTLALETGATAERALAVLTQRYPALAPELNNGEAHPALFINDESASSNSLLTDGATLYVVWPVSGE